MYHRTLINKPAICHPGGTQLILNVPLYLKQMEIYFPCSGDAEAANSYLVLDIRHSWYSVQAQAAERRDELDLNFVKTHFILNRACTYALLDRLDIFHTHAYPSSSS